VCGSELGEEQMKTLTVICPAYNEEDVIESFYRELKAVLVGLAGSYEAKIIFIVDGATDATLDILKRLTQSDPATQIISFSTNFGHQMALIAGLDHCDSDAVVMMDSDLQHPPSLIPAMVNAFEKGYSIVYTIRRDSRDVPLFKRISAKLFYRLLNRISRVQINEGAADFRLISRQVVEVFQTQIRERNQFLRGLFAWVGFKSIGIPFQVRSRGGGQSKYSLVGMLRFGLNGMVAFSKRPLLTATFVGLILAALGFSFALLTVLQYFLHNTAPSGWATLTILITIFSGTQLIFLGVLGVYIGAIFDEVKRRPHYLIEEKINFDGQKNQV
jgi:glycosyltransferase involved in cell wall biosynthesis